jgi:long-chain acyl-CoA synthetase
MILQRWQQVFDQHHNAVALTADGRGFTFAELQTLALDHTGDVAQGSTLEVVVALLAAILKQGVVQVVEKDRQRRMPWVTPPPGTFLVKQTVGSTGMRRCQFFSAEQIMADVDRLHAAMKLVECDAVVSAISPAHSYGLTVTVLQTLLQGLPLQVVNEPFPQQVKAALSRCERAFLPGIPALWKAWLIGQVDLSAVHHAVSAGSPLSLELERRCLETRGVKLHNLYGTSESGAISYDASETLREEASDVGALLPGVELLPHPRGAVFVRSSAVGMGYDENLPGEIMGEGEFLSCDVGELRAGRLHWISCQGAGINVAGRKISPHEIAAKLSHTLGLAVEVRGEICADVERCQQVVARVAVPAEELTMAFKQRACANLAPWELPRRWESLGA